VKHLLVGIALAGVFRSLAPGPSAPAPAGEGHEARCRLRQSSRSSLREDDV
jgi:hypothetical protein